MKLWLRFSRDFRGARMLCLDTPWRHLRLFWRGFDCPQWPYVIRRTGLAFGAGPVGVMVMRWAGTPTRERPDQ